jgi:hypothetical protein
LFVRAAGVGVEPAIREVLDVEAHELFTAFHGTLREAYERVLDGRQAPRDIAEPLFVIERGARLNVAIRAVGRATRMAVSE